LVDLTAMVGCCAPLAREPLTTDQAVDLARVFKAMGDPVRLRLLSLIASHEGGEACVCDLSDVFELTGPTISHHLKVLREAGLITGTVAAPGSTTASNPRRCGRRRRC